MANDTDMLRDISDLRQLRKFKQAEALEKLFSYEYGFGESPFKTKTEFDQAKKDYKQKYKDLDNYV